MASSLDSTTNLPILPTARLTAMTHVGHTSQDRTQWFKQLQSGQSLQGQVVAILDDGTSIVKINATPQASATTVQMTLPNGYAVGDNLQLNFVAQSHHKPGFMLQTPAAFASDVQLSDTALLLDKISHDQTSPHISATRPLSETATEPKILAEALSRSVSHSGVFYESHLKQWHAGQRSLTDIQQEPQNTTGVTQPTGNPWLAVQLDSLENQRFAWSGEVWPQQNLEWDINRDQTPNSAYNPSTNRSEDAVWQSSLRLAMPHLGKLCARIQLQGDRVKLQFEVEEATSASALTKASEQLQQALEQSGSHIEHFSVHNDVSA